MADAGSSLNAGSAPNAPAMAPPPGVTPNFVDPPSIRGALTGLIVATMLMVIVLLALRVWVKVRVIKSWCLDDTFCALAVVFLLTWTGISAGDKFARYMSRDEWNLYEADMDYITFYDYILEILFCPAMMTAKLSVIFQIERLFTRGQRDALFYVVWTVTVATIVYYTVMLFVFAFQCSPPGKYWDPAIPGHCMNIFSLVVTQASFNIVSDFATFALPVWAILRLNARLRKTLELIAVFSCGIVACVLGILGLVFRLKLYNSPDVSRGLLIIGMFSAAEVSTVITVGCIPAIVKLFFTKKPKPTEKPPAAPENAGIDCQQAAVDSPPPNRFLHRFSAFRDSQWARSGKINSLARHLGPAQFLRRDHVKANENVSNRGSTGKHVKSNTTTSTLMTSTVDSMKAPIDTINAL